MEFQQYGWPAYEQADAQIARDGSGYDGAVSTTAAWDGSQVVPPTPGQLMATGFDFTHGLVGDTPIQERPRNQAFQEEQPRNGPGAQTSCVYPQGDDWDYVVEVWPGVDDDDEDSLKSLADHIYQVNAAFEKKGLDYRFAWQDPINPEDLVLFGPCRRYVLPRQYRDTERGRLKFLQIFNNDRPYNKALRGYWTGAPKNAQPRMKPIPKPQRQIVKNRDGKFICTWHDCGAAVKEFSRKCEWNKHMDKHERPYKCLAAGCENIPGFTYSGGLLRHEREVHRKHGGPKNPLYCPHIGCKRNKSSSFARLENLNEHLRRCHTSNGTEPATKDEELDLGPGPSRIETLPDASPLPAPILPIADSPVPSMASPRLSSKRKADDEDLREENKRLRFENQELKRKIEAGYLQQSAMMEQIDLLEKEKATLLNQLKDVNLVVRSNPLN
ncbi:hypothetical protein GQX73_g7900 [Xylaria multiplex]|uniref:C2H2-type domain-containing protein n=1 Tax=Xylaria multiplex TaxID=323545 RepID=A0A7C8N111_9PEZI|nr:hypothetical protein GQX73_g7900 [Xylaria multiplex]